MQQKPHRGEMEYPLSSTQSPIVTPHLSRLSLFTLLNVLRGFGVPENLPHETEFLQQIPVTNT
jgi:hypothetical protein